MPAALSTRTVWILTLLLYVLSALPRFYFLGQSAHPDPLLWFVATQKFCHGLATHHFQDTLQYSHPGVMAMWIAAAAMKVHGLTHGAINQQGLVDIKLPGAIFGSLMPALTFPLLLSIRSIGRERWIAVLTLCAFMATEPFLVEQSRIGELDVPSLVPVWFGFWLLARGFDDSSWKDAAWAGVLFGLGVVTKVAVAPVPAAVSLVLVGHTVYTRFRDLRGLRLVTIATGCALATVFVIWPALWVAPVHTIQYVVSDVSGMANVGHHHVINGISTRDPGVAFYAKYLEVTIPPETALLALAGAVSLWWVKGLRRGYGWIIFGLVVSLIVVAVTPKKLQRYVLAVAPILCMLISGLAAWLVEKNPLKLRQAGFWVLAGLALFVIGRSVRIAREMPYAQYCDDWLDPVTCSRPSSMFFMRDVGKAIHRDWGARAETAKPVVFMKEAERMAPWCPVRKTTVLSKADYAVVWDEEDPAMGSRGLSNSVKSELSHLKRAIATIRYKDRVIARVFRLHPSD